MENKGHLTAQDIQIQGVLDNFLKLRSTNNNSTAKTHLDEDSLTAFVEGNLGRRESQSIVSHLVNCSFCRHITAELVKLDYAFAEIEEVRPVKAEAEPSRISEVLSGLLARIFGSNEEAVFALEEKKEDSEKAEKTDDTEEN